MRYLNREIHGMALSTAFFTPIYTLAPPGHNSQCTRPLCLFGASNQHTIAVKVANSKSIAPSSSASVRGIRESADMAVIGDFLPPKGLLQTTKLYEYVLETSVYPREPELLKELREITTTHPWSVMSTAPDAGQFMSLMLRLLNAKNTIELGVFTGYSLLLTALAIPEDGKITAIDMDRSAYELGLPVIRKAGVEDKINFIESEALPALHQLLEDPKNQEAFDFAFVDADKENYVNYHEKLLQLIKPEGVIIYDNTLWWGTVAMEEESVPPKLLESRNVLVKFNKFLAEDTRVQISQVPLGDGITICRRL